MKKTKDRKNEYSKIESKEEKQARLITIRAKTMCRNRVTTD